MPQLQTDLLKGLPPEAEARMMGLGRPLTLTAGTVLFRLGEPADSLHLVLRGAIALTLPLQIQERTEDMLIEEKLPGETVGWSGLIPPHRFTLNAAARRESEVLAFDRKALFDLFAEQPRIGHIVTRNVGAVVAHRLAVFQTMWLREMQRSIELRQS